MEESSWDVFASCSASGSLWTAYQLARSLAQRRQSVRLFVDDVSQVAIALADVDPALWVQNYQGLELCDVRFAAVCATSRHMVQVFGSRVPTEYLSRFAAHGSGKQWIQLERPDSVRPSKEVLNVAEETSTFVRYTARIGDLPTGVGHIKPHLAPVTMRNMRSGPRARAALFGCYGLPESLVADGAMAVYLAAYPSTRIGPWLKQFQASDRPVCVFVHDGDLQARVSKMAARPSAKDTVLRFGSLTLVFLTPMRWFLEDELIWTSDLVMTDQADKAYRAVMCGTPLIWGGSDPGNTNFVDWCMPRAAATTRNAVAAAFDALATADGVPEAWQSFHGPHWQDVVALAKNTGERIERSPELAAVLLASLAQRNPESIERQFSPTLPNHEEALG